MSVDSHLIEQNIIKLRQDFQKTLPSFLNSAGIPLNTGFKAEPEKERASPVYFVTGVTFTPYDVAVHGDNETHAFSSVVDGRDEAGYLMNNTAALCERLILSGERVVIHTANPHLVERIVSLYDLDDQEKSNVTIISGDLSEKAILPALYGVLETMSEQSPISDIRMALYQSFAQQGDDMPFKPMHIEQVEEVHRASNRRVSFVYNMVALGYDLLENRELNQLRIVSLSALAAHRPSYGLLADASDKFMNDLSWRTFHHEANVLTEKPVTIYQVNPGITTACSVYNNPDVRQLLVQESIADGFPFSKGIMDSSVPLPQLSSLDIALVADAMLRTPDTCDPNQGLPKHIQDHLYGGYSPEELSALVRRAVVCEQDEVSVDCQSVLPEHLLAPATSYGSLPKEVIPGDYRRISLCPLGQRF